MQNKLSHPLVSVIIPIFNGETYLEKSIKSALNNNFKDFEIILVNDGSKDSSLKIAAELAKKHKNIKVYSFDKNQGLGNVLNFALEKASGKYIARLNQDDLMHPDRLKLQSELLEKDPEVLVVGSYLTQFNQDGDIETILYPTTDKEIKQKWLLVSPFADPAVMYRKDAALKLGGYNQDYWPAEDLHMWYRLGKIGKLANIAKPLTKMRIHNKAASQTHFKTQIRNTYKVHRWANKNVEKAPLVIQIYWLAQFISGMSLGPKINWFLYKKVKAILS